MDTPMDLPQGAVPDPGAGYQMWQTTGDRPYTPVFATAEELAEYCANNPFSSLDGGITKEQWLKFINGPGWAATGVYTPDGGLQSGVIE